MRQTWIFRSMPVPEDADAGIAASVNSPVLGTGQPRIAATASMAFCPVAATAVHSGIAASIDRMSVEGLISDNRLEIFPFVLSIDRYTLAMSGVQNLDSSFKYHISVIESPLLFRMGVDLSGTFDDFKFKIGKAKFKSTDVPVFSTVVDKAKLNLAQSIHDIFIKGAEAAIRENENQQAIADFKKRTGYVQAVDEQLDSLSTEEKAEYEAQDAQ